MGLASAIYAGFVRKNRHGGKITPAAGASPNLMASRLGDFDPMVGGPGLMSVRWPFRKNAG
jgi:hypothetical protein